MNRQFRPQSDGDRGLSQSSLAFSSIGEPYNPRYRVVVFAKGTLGCLPASGSLSSIAGEDERALHSVVMICTTSMSPDYSYPWQKNPPRQIWGSGFVIPGKRIVTNAHVVADHISMQVKKHLSPIPYEAEVLDVGRECDLAILEVHDKEFWADMSPLELEEDIPPLGKAVDGFGYPQGQDNICITRGFVSRVQLTQYAHGMTELLAIRTDAVINREIVDAVINPGNSGGPALDKVVSVAFQNLPGSENVRYLIPVPVIKPFIPSDGQKRKFPGICSFGLSCRAHNCIIMLVPSFASHIINCIDDIILLEFPRSI